MDNETPEALVARMKPTIENWLGLKANLAAVTLSEKEARATVSSAMFPSPVKGTQRFDLGGGYKLKLVHGYTYSLGIKDAETSIEIQVQQLHAAIASLGNEGPFLADRLIRWKPELVASEYEKLDMSNPTHAKAKELIGDLLAVKDASPQLTFEEPKAK